MFHYVLDAATIRPLAEPSELPDQASQHSLPYGAASPGMPSPVE